jgi:hypothetical protein
MTARTRYGGGGREDNRVTGLINAFVSCEPKSRKLYDNNAARHQ